MYPFLRLAAQTLRVRRMPPLGLFDPHVIHIRCLPWDLDPWIELNNGRTLTLYDIGRVPFVVRLGLLATLRRNDWGLTVAGASVRYRRRVKAFDRVEMRTRLLGWDSRFFYISQSMWRNGECTSHLLNRSAVTGPAGIVDPARVVASLGQSAESPPLPGWVAAWIEAEAARPWPPRD